MIKKEEDRITRAGLQAFAKKCKETFLLPAILDNIASNNKAIIYEGSLPSTNGIVRFLLNMLGSPDADSLTNFSLSSADVYIDLTTASKTFYYDNGVTKIDSIYYNVATNTDGTGVLSVYFITSLYGATVLRSATFYADENLSIVNMSKTWDGLDDSMVGNLYKLITKKIIPTNSGDGASFDIATGPADEDKLSYSPGSIFDTILQARQLNHKLQFLVDNTQTDYTTDLSPVEADVTTIYVKGVSLNTGSFSGSYDRVTVANGVVINGVEKDEIVADSDNLGYIKLGYTATTTKDIPLKLDNNNRAYVELPTGLLTYKGSVAKYDDLPSTNNTNGDVYSTEDGAEYVWLVKDSGDGVWEYLGEKFQQAQVDWNATEGVTSILNKPTLAEVATSGDYTKLSNLPTLSLSKPTSEQNGSILIGDTTIDIENASTVTKDSDDILVSKAYVDAAIPTNYVLKVTVNGTDLTADVSITTTDCIRIGEQQTLNEGETVTNEYKPTAGTILLPAYPEVPEIYIGTVKYDFTANVTPKKIVLPEVTRFKYNELEVDTQISAKLFGESAPDYNCELTYLIKNISNNNAITITISDLAYGTDTPIKMTLSLTIPVGKYGELCFTHYVIELTETELKKHIVTINGGVQV